MLLTREDVQQAIQMRKDGMRVEQICKALYPHTDFINCTVWRKQAENVAQYLKKGSLAGLQGRIQVSSYDDKDGKRVYQTEVVADSVRFLDSKNDGSKSSAPQNTPKPASSNAFDPFAGTPADNDINSSDLPF